jgi:HAMP domain-containing protein
VTLMSFVAERWVTAQVRPLLPAVAAGEPAGSVPHRQ